MPFNDLPEEILSLIFDGLSIHDLCECQKVCQTWKEPAKLLLLENVHISNRFDLHQFLNCIDMDPTSLRPDAVKVISIGQLVRSRSMIPFEPASIKRLLLRLPSLKHIIVNEQELIPQLLDDEFCRDLAQNCSRLQSYTTCMPFLSSSRCATTSAYYDFMYKLRHILTCVGLDDYKQGDPIDYFAGFPQLKEASCRDLINLQLWLPLFERYSGLKILACHVNSRKEEKLWEIKDGRTIENLSKLKELSLTEHSNTLNPKLVDFLRLYVTGLSKFSLNFIRHVNWDDTTKSLVCHQLLDYVCRLDCFSIRVDHMTDKTFSDCLKLMLQKVFRQSYGNNILHVQQKESNDRKIGLRLNTTRLERTIVIQYNVNQLCMLDKLLGSSSPIHGVDTLRFTSRIQDDNWSIHNFLEIWLDGISSLKKVILDISYFYHYCHILELYPHITHLQLNLEVHALARVALHKCITIFPNVKFFKLYYSCGLWNEDLHKYQIYAKDWNLERLNVDVTPIRVKTGETLKKPTTLAEAYFVIAVDIKQGHYLYKVSMDYLRITRINDKDIEDQICGQDYVRLHITTASLEYLDLHMYRNILEPEADLKYFEENNKDIMNAKISFV